MTEIAPLAPNLSALDFLLHRRSRPPKHLGDRVPDRDTLRTILTAAARVPDHGKLTPWRFIVLERAACLRIAQLMQMKGEAWGLSSGRIDQVSKVFSDTHMIVAVVSTPKSDTPIPEDEQRASAAALCLGLVNAALASGWGACWLTGWCATHRGFLTEALGLADEETLVGYVHIGNEISPPSERPRPDIDALTTWVSA